MIDDVVPIKGGPGSKAKAAGGGKAANLTRVRVMLPPKLTERLDGFIARQPEPKPSRGKAVKMLMRRAFGAASSSAKKPAK
jgi:hypothetical protein